MNCYRNAGSYGGERSGNMGQDGDGRMPTGTQKHRTNRREQEVDVKPSGKDISSAPGQYCAVMKVL